MPIIYGDNGRIKRPNVPKHEYTKEEIEDVMKCMRSLTYFTEKCISPQKLTSKQKEILELYENNRFVILKCIEGFDKSLLTVLTALWYSMFDRDKTIAILSDTNDNAKILGNRFKEIYEKLPMYLKPGVILYNMFSVDFDNGTRILFRRLWEGVLCGESPNLIIVDEYPEEKLDKHSRYDFFTGSFPAIASNDKDKMFLISSNKNPPEIFNNLWKKSLYTAGNEFKHIEITE